MYGDPMHTEPPNLDPLNVILAIAILGSTTKINLIPDHAQ